MKIHEQLRELRHYGPDRTRGTTFAVDAALAAQLPRLALPTMSEAARAAFRALLDYEAPTSNGSLIDTLALIEARGYTVHPCDWIPDFRWLYAGSHPSIYQSWSDYLSENGYPGITAGTMSVAELQAWGQLALLQMSVTQELETGKLPVNISYDPLRYLAKIVDKEAARTIMDEAIALGMSPDHPRLTMVKLNLAL